VVEPVLGTRLTIRVDGADEVSTERAVARALAEADRLEALLTAHRQGSAFQCWRDAVLERVPAELVDVLDAAERWHVRSAGAFDPSLGAAVARWRRAEDEQSLPDRVDLRRLVRQPLPFAIRDGVAERLGDCRSVDLQGIAKGWIVDRVVEAVLADPDVDAVVIDIGGDVRHAGRPGSSAALVALEDPRRTGDNADPLAVVALHGMAVATSGGMRRGWRIGDEWYGHVLDPRTGWPLPPDRSASVVTRLAVDADALASACIGLPVDDALLLVAREGAAALVVDDSGDVHANDAWRSLVV
jgi:thiamine biosynthesis lipoprotein